MLDEKWTYWKGPRFRSSLPIKWKIVADPLDKGTVVMTDDPAAAGGKYGTADVVTKKKYRDFRLHAEFLVVKKGGNSGVYMQNRYEIQFSVVDCFVDCPRFTCPHPKYFAGVVTTPHSLFQSE